MVHAKHPQRVLVWLSAVTSLFSGAAFSQDTDTESKDSSPSPEATPTPDSSPVDGAPTPATPDANSNPADAEKPTTQKKESERSDTEDEQGSIERQSKVKEQVKRKTKKAPLSNEISGTGFGIFGGADLGMIFTAPSSKLYKTIETSQLGFAPTLKFGGSVFTRRIALDFGLGLQYANYGGKLLSLPIINEDGELDFAPLNKSYNNSQTTLYIESAGRLRFKNKVQAGLLANVIFSTTSAGFTSLPGVEPPEKYVALIGPQVVYETPFKNYISRLTGSFTLSLTGTNRTAYIASIGAGLGSYLVSATTTVKTKSETRVRTKITREVIQLKAKEADVTDNISFIFDSQMVNFKLNSAELNPKSAGFLTALGEMFVRERDLWNQLLIEGHTDSRGSAAYNLKLSNQRAVSVLNQLQKAGIPRQSLEAAGRGSTQLLVTPERNEVDYARNRRVEIRILGLKDARALKKYVDEVQEKFFGKPAVTRSIPVPKPTTTEPSTEPQTPAWDPGLETPEKSE